MQANLGLTCSAYESECVCVCAGGSDAAGCGREEADDAAV